MTAAPIAITDPRHFPDRDAASPDVAALYLRAEASLAAETGRAAGAADEALRAALAPMLASDGPRLAALVGGAPSVAVARHLWRLLDALCRPAQDPDAGVAATLFAIPVVVVAGLEGATTDATLPGILPDPGALATILQDHGALSGNRTFALASALVGVDAIDLVRLPELLAWQKLADGARGDPAAPGAAAVAHALAPAPIPVAAGREAVSLRFVVGTALAKPGFDLLADATVGKWGIPFTRELGRQIGGGEVPVLALPRPPQRLLPAAQQGRAAQREVSAQIFVGNALRRLRAAVGEPTAVISAHHARGAAGGGELRLSLSSPFEPRDAEGFRCPLYPLDRVADVAAMLVQLLGDCRVADVRVLAGVHPDRDPGTGLRLLFKPDTIPPTAALVH